MTTSSSLAAITVIFPVISLLFPVISRLLSTEVQVLRGFPGILHLCPPPLYRDLQGIPSEMHPSSEMANSPDSQQCWARDSGPVAATRSDDRDDKSERQVDCDDL